MTVRPRHPAAIGGLVAIGVFSIGVASTAAAQVSSYLHSVAPAAAYPSAAEVWAHVSYALSIDCSPPRACYAKSQWIRAYVHCYTGSVAVLERVSLDLNGNVVATAVAESVWFKRPANDLGAVTVLGLLCGYRDDGPYWYSGPDGVTERPRPRPRDDASRPGKR